jgi:hypothetical protein
MGRRAAALTFEHRRIVHYAGRPLRNKPDYTGVGFELLPSRFTLTGFQVWTAERRDASPREAVLRTR